MNVLLPQLLGTEADVLIVGSGYGGSVAALRFSQAGRSVTVLEQGDYLPAHKLPSNTRDLLMRTSINRKIKGLQNPLFDLRMYNDATVVLGRGVGGGSLINAGIVMEPEIEVFRTKNWPSAIRRMDELEWRKLFNKTKLSLESQSLSTKKFPPKAFVSEAAKRLNLDLSYPQMTIDQEACTGCGNCVTGCIYGAKLSLDKTYLERASHLGARIFPNIEVQYFKKLKNSYRVFYKIVQPIIGTLKSKQGFLDCRSLVLAAGAFGSTELLMRSASSGELEISDRVGEKFSLNGGNLSWLYSSENRVQNLGIDKNQLQKGESVPGPCLTSVLKHKGSDGMPMLIEEALFPAVNSFGFLGPMMSILSGASVKMNSYDIKETIISMIMGYKHGAAARSPIFLGVAGDAAQGKLVLNLRNKIAGQPGIDLHWPHQNHQKNYKEFSNLIRELSNTAGGIYCDHRGMLSKMPISVHSLGGCSMADDPNDGVVDDCGRVFQRSGGIHKELYVLDGSILPSSLYSNPFLTIAALSERALEKVLQLKRVQFNEENKCLI